jgi:hypothetical protein
MPDGSPQRRTRSTQTVRIFDPTPSTVSEGQEHPGDPRVAVAVSDPSNPSRYAVRGEVLSVTSEGAAEHIRQLAQLPRNPYPWYGGRDRGA